MRLVLSILVLTVCCANLCFAQFFGVPGFGWGGWGGWGGATVGSAAMAGMSEMIHASGQFGLMSSAAAVNLEKAQNLQLDNNVKAANVYLALRAADRADREAERQATQASRLTMQQLAAIASAGAPKALDSLQADPVSGAIHWPSALQQPSFEAGRHEMDQVFAERAKYGGLPYSAQVAAKRAIDGMFDDLKGQVKTLPPQQYVECRNFLRSLLYDTTKASF